MNAEVLAFVLYFVLMLAIGVLFFFKEKGAGEKEYFLGGRHMGPWVTAMSAQASDMSAWLLMGLPGSILAFGFGQIWIGIGLAIGTALNWILVARRLRCFSEAANDSITLPQYLSNRFATKSLTLQIICAVIFLVCFTIYVASAFVSGATVFTMVFPSLSNQTAMLLFALIIIIYTFLGGYKAVCWTDFFQGLLMLCAVLAIPIAIVTTQNLDVTALETVYVNAADGTQYAFGSSLFTASWQDIISGLAWGLGYFGMPQVLVRFLSIRSSEEIKKSRIIATTWCVISLACGVCIGLVGRAMMPTQFATQAAAENIFIVVSQALLPSFMCGIVVSGIFAASMSSSSSYMIIGASAVGENIFRGLLHRKATDRQVMMVARITLLVMFIFGIVVAFDQNSSIFQVVSYAWAGLGASFGPLMLTSLYWRRTNKYGAIAGMLSGTATVLIWHNLVKPLGGVFAIYELLPAFIISLLFIVVVSLLTAKPNKRMLYEFDHYMDDPLPGTLPSGTVLVDEPMEAMESEVRSGK